MATERRCDGCAYYEPTESPYETDGVQHASTSGKCHHSTAGDDPNRASAWWCSEWWPKDRPLPEPWNAPDLVTFCEHGRAGAILRPRRPRIRPARRRMNILTSPT
ncbi:MAG: hypothetical protein AAB922_02330, partial [Patescibacteria group bacterium]